jgi:hypothetical protein
VVGKTVIGLFGLGLLASVVFGLNNAYRQTMNDSMVEFGQTYRKMRAA